ncbi:sulfate reduction electron transfer complex DsrMKJOP subunit DsrJ [Bacteroidota bacterium]
MYNGGKIIIGIIIFAFVFSSPIWVNWLNPAEAHNPVLKYPENYKECVADKAYMNAFHMDMLNQWRDSVVRLNIRYLNVKGKPFTIDGKQAEMSLTKTCLNCHSDKVNFCDQCHNFLNVVPYCWDCHVDKYEAPKEEVKKEHDCNHEHEHDHDRHEHGEEHDDDASEVEHNEEAK